MPSQSSSSWSIAALAIAALAAPIAALASQGETPPGIAGVQTVSADRARSVQESGAIIVDARTAGEFAEAHVKGAASVAYKGRSANAKEFDAAQDNFEVSRLPADKAVPIIFYCNGSEGWQSYKAAVMAKKAGFTHVFWMRGGLPEWKAKGLPVE